MLNNVELEQLPLGRHSKSETGLAHGFIKGKQGSYDVLHVLGFGSTSKVKLIKDRASGMLRALKIIYPHDEFSCVAAKLSYENEFKILKKLGKVDPVEINTVSKKTGVMKYQIVMDLAEGHELWELIHKKSNLLPKTTKQLLELGLNILLDLYNIHQQGILLIDDKTENIFVGRDPNQPDKYKVTRVDFGYAQDGYDFKKDAGLKIPYRGTLQVSAPEVLNSCGLDYKGFSTYCKATEIYTLGKLLEELFLNNYFSTPYVSSSIHLLILHMMSPKPKDRPSLEEAIETFEKALNLKIGSSHLNINKNQMIHQAVEATQQEQKPALQPDAFSQACNEYKKDKNRYFGFRWLLANQSTLKIQQELENTSDRNIQYQKAKDFITQHPYSRFATKLANASEDVELKKIIQDASPRWHF